MSPATLSLNQISAKLALSHNSMLIFINGGISFDIL